jgi:hypothetical protein
MGERGVGEVERGAGLACDGRAFLSNTHGSGETHLLRDTRDTILTHTNLLEPEVERARAREEARHAHRSPSYWGRSRLSRTHAHALRFLRPPFYGSHPSTAAVGCCKLCVECLCTAITPFCGPWRRA